MFSEILQLSQIWRYDRSFLLLWQSDNFWSVWSQSTGYSSEFSLHMAICSAANPKMLVFCYIRNQQKTHIFFLKFFNENNSKSTNLHLKKLFYQTFSGLNNYHSIRPMLANLYFSYYWPKAMLGNTQCQLHTTQYNLPLFPVLFF